METTTMATYFGDSTSNDYEGGDEDDFIYGYGDKDYLHGNDGVDFIAGGDGDDYLEGGEGDDILLGLNDNDFLFGGTGADVLSGGNGIDLAYYAGSTAININLTSGEASGGDAEGDELTSIENVWATDYNDFLVGSNVANVIQAWGGQDTILGLDGADTIDAGTGDDVVAGGTGADTMDGGGGIDTLSYAYSANGVTVNLTTGQGQHGEAEGDIISGFENLVGSNNADTLTGTNVANIIRGYTGNDTIKGGGGADTMLGDGGVDTLSYVGSATGVTIDIEAGTAFGGDALGDIFSSIENLEGTSWVDSLLGNSLRNVFHSGNGMDTLNGRDGNDELHGGNAADTITGGAGDDDLYGDTGADTMIGGLGNDDFYVDNAGDVVSELAGQGADTIYAALSYTIAANVAKLQLTGSAAINATGRDGQADTLFGNSGVNIINGKSGGDLIAGGLGTDNLTGGAGTDIFRFDTAPGASNKDTIVDFSAPSDTIQLDNAIYTDLVATGFLAADLFKNLNLGAQDTDDRILYNDTTGAIFYDADGLGGAASVQFALLAANPTVTAADFAVI
jgi:Ca2+-binding RTX toxin-like protein